MGLIIVYSIYAIIFGAVSYKMYQEYQWEKSWYGIPSFESKFFYIIFNNDICKYLWYNCWYKRYNVKVIK